MKTKGSFNSYEHIAALNNVKKAFSLKGTFTKEQLINAFKGIGLPTNSCFWCTFLKAEIIEIVKRGRRGQIGLYKFKFEEPIYVERLTQIHNEYLKKLKETQSRHYKKANEIEEKPLLVEILPPSKDPIQDAINLLKENGYLIFKAV